jgi:hypothetical protein
MLSAAHDLLRELAPEIDTHRTAVEREIEGMSVPEASVFLAGRLGWQLRSCGVEVDAARMVIHMSRSHTIAALTELTATIAAISEAGLGDILSGKIQAP